MTASDVKFGKPASFHAGDAAEDAADSLARTLEDLETRLSRLSDARREPAPEPREHDPRPGRELRSMASRLRANADNRLTGTSRLAIEATGSIEEGASRRRRANAVLDRRIGTIAGEVETLKMQGSTLQLVTGIAEDIQRLKDEIAETVSARTDESFEEIRLAFEDLCERLSQTDRSGVIAQQVDDILGRLSAMSAAQIDRASIDVLRDDLEHVARLAGEAAREDSLLSATRRWEDFEARLEGHMELDAAAKLQLKAEMERLRETVRSLATEDQIRAIEQRWDEFEAKHFEKMRSETEGRFTRLLRAELKTLSERVEFLADAAVAAEVDRSERIETSERTHDALQRLTQRLEQLEVALEELPEVLAIERLEIRLEDLSASVAAIAREQQEPDLEHFLILEERLDEISEALVSSALKDEPTIDLAPIARMEARLAELTARVDDMTAAGDTSVLTLQIAELTSRIEELSAQAGAAASEEQFATFSARIEAAIGRMDRPSADTAMFERRLSALADRLEEVAAAQVDEEVLRSLETQITRLGLQLSEGLSFAQPDAGGDIDQRLQALETRLEQNREEVMTAARAAADEAVRLIRADGPNRDGEHIRNLSEDLRSLEALCRETDDRSIKVFDAVHSTLVKIADRLTVIEGEVRGRGADTASPAVRLAEFETILAEAQSPMEAPEVEAPSRRSLRGSLGRRNPARGSRREAEPTDEPVAAASPASPALIEDAPSLDAADSILAREANRPLEPGSGTPDIASLIDRVRLQQQRVAGEIAEPAAKADFIAAARKAALAAAAEADELRREDGPSSSDGVANDGGRLTRHRKPILMAVGAVLLAMMAIPLGRVVSIPDFSGLTIESAAVKTEAPAVAALETPRSQPALPTPTVAPASDTIETDGAQIPSRAALTPTPGVEGPTRSAAAVRPAASEPSIASLAAARAGVSGVETLQAANLVSPASMPLARPNPTLAAVVPVPNVVPVADEAVPGVQAARPTLTDPLLREAVARLPEQVNAEPRTAPSGIGPTALVAASDQNDPKAIFEIGLRLMEGRSGASDVPAAMNWFARAGELGYAPAQYSLGTLFEKGNGVERDTVAARDWYRLAADQGNVRAMHNLAVLYATGIDGKSEPESAARWFTEAAEHGMRDSQYNLGILHARGSGVEQDLGQSYKWFSIVGAAGDRDAVEKRDEVKKALSSDEVAALDAEVAAWNPKPRDEAANAVDIPESWSEPTEQTASVDMTRAIRNVQAILVKLGFDAGTPDGIAGERTVEAVRAFQSQNGLEATGKIDETLIRELLKRNV